MRKRVITTFVVIVFAVCSVLPVSATTTAGGYLFSVFDNLILANIRFVGCQYSNYNYANGVITLQISPTSGHWSMWIPLGNTPYAGYNHVTASAFAIYSPYSVTVSGDTVTPFVAPGLVYTNSGKENYIIFSQNGNSNIAAPFWRCDIPAITGGNNQFFNYYYVIYSNTTNSGKITITIDNYKLSAMLRAYSMTEAEDQRSFMALYTQQISNYSSNWTTGDVSGLMEDVGDISSEIKRTTTGGQSAYQILEEANTISNQLFNGKGGVTDKLKDVQTGFSGGIDNIAVKAMGVIPFITVLGNFLKDNWLLSTFVAVSAALLVAGYIIKMLRRDG